MSRHDKAPLVVVAAAHMDLSVRLLERGNAASAAYHSLSAPPPPHRRTPPSQPLA